MKKYYVLSVIVLVTGLIGAIGVNSHWLFNQPETPSMLSK